MRSVSLFYVKIEIIRSETLVQIRINELFYTRFLVINPPNNNQATNVFNDLNRLMEL